MNLLNYSQSDLVEELRSTARGFSDGEIAPRVEEMDRSDRFPRELWPQMGKLGLFGITAPMEFGGSVWDISRMSLSPKKSRAGRVRWA